MSSTEELADSRTGGIGPRHAARFYADDEFLVDSIVRLAGDGLRAGHAVVVVATQEHLIALRERLGALDVDVDAAERQSQLVGLDAAQTLAGLLVDGWPDADAFSRTIGKTIESAAARFAHVDAFGEMVALLCERGQYGAAVRLEALWNDLGKRLSMSLLCAYRMSAFGDEALAAQFADICAAHTHVHPVEDYLRLDEGERERLVVTLQQRAHALEREIRERKALEQRLAHRERELSDFLDNAVEPLHSVGADGTILWANKAELDLLGYAADEYVGRHFADFHADATRAADCLRHLLAGETLRDFPVSMKCRDGAIKDVLLSSNAYFVDDRFAYTRCFTRDVTTSSRAERQLREDIGIWEVLNRTGHAIAGELDPERLLQTVIDAAVELTGAAFAAFFGGHENGKSGAAHAVSGISRETLAALSIPAFLGAGIVRGDDLAEHAAPGEKLAHSGASSVKSYLAVPVKSRSGHDHGRLFLGHPERGVFTRRDELIIGGIAAQAATAMDNARLFQANDRSRAELGQLNDTLEQHVIERTGALHRSEIQLRRLVAGIEDYAIFMLDANGFVETWNPGAQRIKGYTDKEIIGKHYSEFYIPEDRAAGLPERALAAAVEHGKYEAEAWRVRKDGTRFWANVLLDAIHDENGKLIGFAKVTRDMTERRAMEEQLRQSQKIEAVGQLTGGVAHDFNNLLTVIIGNLEIIWRQAPTDAKLRHAADQAMRGAQRAATLTQQLLAFSRRQPLNPKPVDVNRLVAGMSDLLRRTLSENIAIEAVLAGGLWRTEVDAHQLESVLLNLAVNARDAMPDGGKLTIETANAHLDHAYSAGFAELAPGQYVVICVTDTGTGMTEDVMRHAFEPFFTTKPIGQGTGLGLSQVYGFVKQSGGHVKLYSEPGEGTTVRIYLRRLVVDAVDAAAEAAQPAPVGGSETVLVVEDDTDVRLYSVESLRELGFKVLEATDGTAALRMLEAHPEIDLLFTDIGLPGLNGRQVVEKARERNPQLRVLFTTGYARNAIVHQGRLDEGVELLTKPFNRAQLAQRVRDVLDAPLHHLDGVSHALVVEDEALMRELCAHLLKELGFEVVVAESVAQALDIVRSNPAFDMALIDIGLRDRSGLDLVGELRVLWPRLPIVIASGYDSQSTIAALRGDACTAVLSKPFDARALADALGRLGAEARPTRGRRS